MFLQNFINLSNAAAELLRSVNKFKMAAVRRLQYLVTLDHPRSILVDRKLFIFCVNRIVLRYSAEYYITYYDLKQKHKTLRKNRI